MSADWFYRIDGNGFDTEMKLEAVQKGNNLLMIRNNDRIGYQGSYNFFASVGGINFTELANDLLAQVEISPIELTEAEREGGFVRNEHLMKEYIKRSQSNVVTELKSVNYLKRKKGLNKLSELGVNQIFELLDQSEVDSKAALEKLLKLFG